MKPGITDKRLRAVFVMMRRYYMMKEKSTLFECNCY